MPADADLSETVQPGVPPDGRRAGATTSDSARSGPSARCRPASALALLERLYPAHDAVLKQTVFGGRSSRRRSAWPPASTRTPRASTPWPPSASAPSRSARSPARPQPGNPQPRLFRLIARPRGGQPHGLQQRRRRGGRAPAERAWPSPSAGTGRRSSASTSARPRSCRRTRPSPTTWLDQRCSPPLRRLPRRQRLLAEHPGPARPAGRRGLRPLLMAVRAAADEAVPGRHVPLLVKIAPDLADADVDAVADLALELGLDGIIATNTTIGRDGLSPPRSKVAAAGARRPVRRAAEGPLAGGAPAAARAHRRPADPGLGRRHRDRRRRLASAWSPARPWSRATPGSSTRDRSGPRGSTAGSPRGCGPALHEPARRRRGGPRFLDPIYRGELSWLTTGFALRRPACGLLWTSGARCAPGSTRTRALLAQWDLERRRRRAGALRVHGGRGAGRPGRRAQAAVGLLRALRQPRHRGPGAGRRRRPLGRRRR